MRKIWSRDWKRVNLERRKWVQRHVPWSGVCGVGQSGDSHAHPRESQWLDLRNERKLPEMIGTQGTSTFSLAEKEAFLLERGGEGMWESTDYHSQEVPARKLQRARKRNLGCVIWTSLLASPRDAVWRGQSKASPQWMAKCQQAGSAEETSRGTSINTFVCLFVLFFEIWSGLQLYRQEGLELLFSSYLYFPSTGIIDVYTHTILYVLGMESRRSCMQG